MNQQPQSETPETDAAVFKVIGSLQSGTEDVVRAEKCRDLERRLRAAEEASAQWSYCAKAFCDSISNPYQLGVSERCEKALKLMAALEDGEDTTGVNPFLELASLEAKLTAAEARLQKAYKRDGEWLDEHGCCRVCDGELPHGHSENCDYYKLDAKLTALQTAAEGMERALDACVFPEEDDPDQGQHNGMIYGEICWAEVRRIRKALARYRALKEKGGDAT